MKIENQVCSYDQAQILVQLGIKMKSYFLYNSRKDIMESWIVDGTEDHFLPAFTVAELGAMLPNTCFSCFSVQYSDGWEACYSDNIPSIHLAHHKTEAESRAALLIHILEKGVVLVSEINERIKDFQ